MRQRLSRADWITAALRALTRRGVAAVAIDPLAAELGVTRGSFYWHFKDRAALIEAALSSWEQKSTIDVIAQVADIADPREQLRRVLTIALTEDPTGGLEAALVAHADDPVVAPPLQRVTDRRLAFLTEVYGRAGLPADEARRAAVVAYAAYIGWIELRRVVSEGFPTALVESEADLGYLIERLMPPPAGQLAR